MTIIFFDCIVTLLMILTILYKTSTIGKAAKVYAIHAQAQALAVAIAIYIYVALRLWSVIG